MVPDADYRIKLQVFEGPLDLLLFLIRKNELDIYDIPIESVTKQYIEALHTMQQLDLDVAGEFFVMAATLMEIKSRLLLPRGQAAVDPNADDEDIDPRWELVHQLLQYKKFKEAAGEIALLARNQQDHMERFVSSMSDQLERSLKNVDRIDLWQTFNLVLRRLAEKLVVGEIHDEVITVSDKMEEILLLTQTEKSFLFTRLLEGGGPITLRRLVATFLAVLELTRLTKLRVKQDEAFSDIIVSVVEAAPPPPPVAEETPPPTDTPPAPSDTPPAPVDVSLAPADAASAPVDVPPPPVAEETPPPADTPPATADASPALAEAPPTPVETPPTPSSEMPLETPTDASTVTA